MEDYLKRTLAAAKALPDLGKAADYIPELAGRDPHKMSVAVMDVEGKMKSAGEEEEVFTLQSISKIITLTMALMEYGEKEVFSKVGVESVDLPFNTIRSFTIKPNNPMINAGAIVISSLLRDKGFESFLNFVQKLANNDAIYLDEKVYESEKSTGYRNYAIAYYLRDLGNIEKPRETLDYYFKQCSVALTVKDLATIAAVYANDGIHPVTEERMIDTRSAEIVKTIMAICGMYDASGDFLLRVGIPSKSGVSGGILSVVPRRYGIGVFSAGLDETGNSVAGVHMLETLAEDLKLNIFTY